MTTQPELWKIAVPASELDTHCPRPDEVDTSANNSGWDLGIPDVPGPRD